MGRESSTMYVVSTMGSGDLGRELDLDSVIQTLNDKFDIGASKQSDSYGRA
jgi:hypothetical protein